MQSSRKLILCVAIAVLHEVALCNSSVLADDKYSPDGRYRVRWTDDDYGETIKLVDVKTKELIFKFDGLESYTLVAWNKTSTRCAVEYHPNNAYTMLWIFTRVKKSSGFTWEKQEMAMPFEGIDTSLDDGIHHLGRGGVNKMRWTKDSLLWCDVMWDRVIYDVYFSAETNPAKIKTIRTDRDFSKE